MGLLLICFPTSQVYELGGCFLHATRWHLCGSFTRLHILWCTLPFSSIPSLWIWRGCDCSVMVCDFRGDVIKGHVASTQFTWEAHIMESSHVKEVWPPWPPVWTLMTHPSSVCPCTFLLSNPGLSLLRRGGGGMGPFSELGWRWQPWAQPLADRKQRHSAWFASQEAAAGASPRLVQ